MYIEIKKAAMGKYILNDNKSLPMVYDTLTELIIDVFYSRIEGEFDGNELSINIDFTFNPPKTIE